LQWLIASNLSFALGRFCFCCDPEKSFLTEYLFVKKSQIELLPSSLTQPELIRLMGIGLFKQEIG
jgi:hypothetical protein